MFFDIGANIGRWSQANMDSCDRIIALEPDTDIFNRLKSNTKSDKIICLNYVVCNSDNPEVEFYKCNLDTLSTLNVEWLSNEKSRFYGESFEKIICKTIKLDKLIELFGIPELIKIDVEGGEYECISSLTQKVDTLCFEWASELKDIAFKCIDYLESIGFTKFYIQNEDHYTFRPNENLYIDIHTTKAMLNNTVPKQDWGMVWCK